MFVQTAELFLFLVSHWFLFGDTVDRGKSLCYGLFQGPDILVNDAALTRNIKLQIRWVTDKKYSSSVAPPCITNFKIDIWIGGRKIRYNESCSQNAFFYRFENVASELLLIASLAEIASRIHCSLYAVMIDIIHFCSKRHSHKDVGFRIRGVSGRTQLL